MPFSQNSVLGNAVVRFVLCIYLANQIAACSTANSPTIAAKKIEAPQEVEASPVSATSIEVPEQLDPHLESVDKLARAASEEHLKHAQLFIEKTPIGFDDSEFTDEFERLEARLEHLVLFAGEFPPLLTNSEDRSKLIEFLSPTLRDAKSYAREHTDTEDSLYFLAELHRLGANLDVANSDRAARDAVEYCLSLHPASELCHFSSMNLYLSPKSSYVGGFYPDRVLRSLTFLQETYAPEVNQSVEAGYLSYYISTADFDNATRQLDYLNDELDYFRNEPETYEKVLSMLDSLHTLKEKYESILP